MVKWKTCRTQLRLTNLPALIYKYIKKYNEYKEQQTKKQTKKSIIGNLSKRLLELEFKHDIQIKNRCLIWIVKNILPSYKL